MAYGSGRLPSRFPVGTKFVIEGKRGGEGQVQVFSRYLEFPDGTFFPLPVRPSKRKSAPSARRARRSRPFHWQTDDRPGRERGAWSAIGLLPKSENPSLRWAGVDGRSVNRLFQVC